MSEINVVPYIDVMLVMLVIFMITAPLLTQGVNVELPRAATGAIAENGQEPLVVSISSDGSFYINIGADPDQPVDSDTLVQRCAAVLKHKPGTRVLVRGDAQVSYGAVVAAMALLQQAGAPSVGLITEPLAPAKGR